MPCIVNAANENVNEGFRKDKCTFPQMADIIEKTMQTVPFDNNPSYDTYINTDAHARRVAEQLLQGIV